MEIFMFQLVKNRSLLPLVIIVTTASIQGMESGPTLAQRIYNQAVQLASIIWTPNQYAQEQAYAYQAHTYNQHNPLLIEAISRKIVDYAHDNNNDQAKSLENSIKNFMNLSVSCKYFSELLTPETIGTLCKHYALEDKNTVLLNLLAQNIAWRTYEKMRIPAFILVYADVDVNICYDEFYCLLEKAVRKDDKELVSLLFKHNANPDTTFKYYLGDNGGPVFFYALKEVAQMFLEHGANIHAQENHGMNVLWHVIENNYPSELIDVTNFLKKATLILNAAPDIINTVNNRGKTPLDCVQRALQDPRPSYLYCSLPYISQYMYQYRRHQALTHFATLLKERGALTVEEIKSHRRAHTNKEYQCIVCWDKSENMRDIPCVSIHPDYICMECYTTIATTGNIYPLCRKKLIE
jgi:hypothetical protein